MFSLGTASFIKPRHPLCDTRKNLTSSAVPVKIVVVLLEDTKSGVKMKVLPRDIKVVLRSLNRKMGGQVMETPGSASLTEPAWVSSLVVAGVGGARLPPAEDPAEVCDCSQRRMDMKEQRSHNTQTALPLGVIGWGWGACLQLKAISGNTEAK